MTKREVRTLGTFIFYTVMVVVFTVLFLKTGFPVFAAIMGAFVGSGITCLARSEETMRIDVDSLTSSSIETHLQHHRSGNL